MRSTLPSALFHLNVGSTEAYIARAASVPMLSQSEELSLARRWCSDGCVDSAKALVMAHLKFVVKIARGYSGYGLQLADLIQEGNIGLMKAVKRFDPEMGVRLVSFAVHWIKSEIHEYIIRNWRIVKVATTKAQRKLFFNLRSSKKRLGWFTEEEIASVADDLGVTKADVREMEARLNAHDATFDAPADDHSTSSNLQLSLPSPSQYLEDTTADPATLFAKSHWQSQMSQALSHALAELKPRERAIVEERWLNDKKVTLHQLAQKYEVSAERVRQIENAAIKKLKGALQAALGDGT